ncbi:hypothetical protein AVEN_206218-1 [Araneus ventricosus]|uniref:PiggyBac transposable element-derived protein domain-containing protein n=1 Tax=Araneus ventricosus TaxID=182803 RepID=A0A4Y2G7L9_ARAVE|nr:hypothetical protein AVEN_206218-1 [Araneus ventricosus]
MASYANREECSEIDESSQSESEDELNESIESDHEFDSDYENYSSSTNEEEDNLNASTGRKRMRLLTDSEDDSEESNERKILKLLLMEQFGKTSKQVPVLADHIFIPTPLAIICNQTKWCQKTPFGRNMYTQNLGRNSVQELVLKSTNESKVLVI